MKRLFFFFLVLFSNGLFASDQSLERVDWSLWRTLPVYDEGRVMPLNTFARQVVMNICGTHRPLIVPDDTFLATVGPELIVQPGESQALASARLEQIKQRIGEMFPNGHRVFEPYELLLSWLVEPDVWEFIPFLPIQDSAYRNEVLLLPTVSKSGRELRAVAPVQLKTSRRFAESLEQAREREWKRATRATGGQPIEMKESVEPERPLTERELTTIRLYNALAAFRNLVPPPIQTTADLPNSFISLLQKGRAEFSQASRFWNQLSDRGFFRLIPEHVPFVSNDCFNAIALIYSQLFQKLGHAENAEEPIDPTVLELQLNALLLLLDKTVQESEEIVRILYPINEAGNETVKDETTMTKSGTDSALKAFRGEFLTYRASLLNLFRLTQGNLIALFGDGHTLRVLPLLFTESIRPDSPGGDQFLSLRELGPWASLNLVLRANPATMQRFVDRDFPAGPLVDEESYLTAIFGSGFSQNQSPATKAILSGQQTDVKKPLISVQGTEAILSVEESAQEIFAGILEQANEGLEIQPVSIINSTVDARIAFKRLADAYIGNLEDHSEESEQAEQAIDFFRLIRNSRAAQFSTGVALFELTLRETASRMEPIRAGLLPPTVYDEEILQKTAYPSAGTLTAEYYYQRLEPFYWMWVTALGAIVAFLLSFVAEKISLTIKKRKQQDEQKVPASKPSLRGQLRNRTSGSLADIGLRHLVDPAQSERNQSCRFNQIEIILVWIGIALLLLSQGITFLGGAMRACISGWAPVTNMFETIVLMCFSAACLGLGFTLQPLLGPPFAKAWSLTAFPRRFKSTAVQMTVMLCRILLMFLTFGIVMTITYSEHVHEQGLLDAVIRSFAMNDLIDWIAVCGTLACLIWFIPRFVLTCLLVPVVYVEHNSRSSTSDLAITGVSVNSQVVNRKVFVLLGALIVLVAGIVTTLNPHDFNPNIRPLAAVLRSNFWLVVHITVIMISYAAGIIAWLLALIALGMYMFGRYRIAETSKKEILVLQPQYCDVLVPYIRKMIQVALWLLMIGTILGARWADYSWGRFWSWDVKEVWALITLLIFLAVLHGRIARFYGDAGILIGAVLGAIAIILTWYGFNYVFGIGRHAYTRGDSQWASLVLGGFIVLNLLWSIIALSRYLIEKSHVPSKKKKA